MKTLPRTIGGKIPPKEHKRLLVEDAAENALETLLFARHRPKLNFIPDKRHWFAPRQMGPMWLQTGHGLSLDPQSDEQIVPHGEDVNSPELVWPMSHGFISDIGEDREWSKGSIQCHFVRTVSPKELRGKSRLVLPYNLLYQCSTIEPGGMYHSAAIYLHWINGRWQSSNGTLEHEWQGNFLISSALVKRYEWAAQFSLGDSAKVLLPVTPAGVKELFKDRDKPIDSDRRKALRHWVRQHARKSARGWADVRAHLRGQYDFNWRGFDVRIRPAAFDEEVARGAA